MRDCNSLRRLRGVSTGDIEPGKRLGNQVVSGWFVLHDGSDFLLDGKRVDHALVVFEDTTEEEVIIIR